MWQQRAGEGAVAPLVLESRAVSEAPSPAGGGGKTLSPRQRSTGTLGRGPGQMNKAATGSRGEQKTSATGTQSPHTPFRQQDRHFPGLETLDGGGYNQDKSGAIEEHVSSA